MSKNKPVWLYIIECEKEVLYVGITDSPRRRFMQHAIGGSWLTKRLRPKRLRCLRKIGDRSEALAEEGMVTRMTHIQKLEYIKKWGIQNILSA
jgi:predicted GIY-YIG superfamily endonuclease